MRLCLVCSKPIPEERRLSATVCSGDCARIRAVRRTAEWRLQHPGSRKGENQRTKSPSVLLRCEICNTDFETRRPTQRVCSPDCQRRAANQRARKWALDNPDRVKQLQRTSRRRRRLVVWRWKYGMSIAEFEALWNFQGGRCAGCGLPIDMYDPDSSIHVDHDHACCGFRPSQGHRLCGKCVRGLLCRSCNTALGLVKDDPAVLLRLAEYLGRCRR